MQPVQLSIILRVVKLDPVMGYVTTVPFTVSSPVTLLGGKGTLKTTLNALLTPAGYDALGQCAMGDLLSVALNDPHPIPSPGRCRRCSANGRAAATLRRGKG